MSDAQPKLYCYNHPDTETTLRCNRCERPICARCAVLTPTGYRCKECVRGQQKIFETALWYDYVLAVVLAGGLSFVGSLLVQVLGFFTIFVAPIAGVVIAEAVRYATGRRRSKRLFQLTTAAAVLGCLPILLVILLRVVGGFGGITALLPLLWQGLYLFTIASTLYYRLAGIQIR